jgi:hypothetical protein
MRSCSITMLPTYLGNSKRRKTQCETQVQSRSRGLGIAREEFQRLYYKQRDEHRGRCALARLQSFDEDVICHVVCEDVKVAAGRS